MATAVDTNGILVAVRVGIGIAVEGALGARHSSTSNDMEYESETD